MSDLIAPVPVNPTFWDAEGEQRKQENPFDNQLLSVLKDIRTELRILNASTQMGLNLNDDLDQARKDPYFNNPTF